MKLLILDDDNELWQVIDAPTYAKSLGINYSTLRCQIMRGKHKVANINGRNYFKLNKLN